MTDNLKKSHQGTKKAHALTILGSISNAWRISLKPVLDSGATKVQNSSQFVSLKSFMNSGLVK